jgi:hypothetical protein
MIEDYSEIKISDPIEFVNAKRVETWETLNLGKIQCSR